MSRKGWLSLMLAALLAATVSAVLMGTATAAGPHVRARDRYRPRTWCPTNRTCFTHMTWTLYTPTRAVGHGRARDCAGGGGPCITSEQTVTLDHPRRLCGHLEFSRLRLFRRTFHAGASPVCDIYY